MIILHASSHMSQEMLPAANILPKWKHFLRLVAAFMKYKEDKRQNPSLLFPNLTNQGCDDSSRCKCVCVCVCGMLAIACSEVSLEGVQVTGDLK